MFRLIVIFSLALSGTLMCSGQNLIPNPGFESVLTCPGGISQFNGYVASWTGANSASPDYAACGSTGNTAIRTTPSSGNAAAGMWGGASHPSCASSAYSEAIRCNLISPVSTGQSYDISMRIKVDGIGSATTAPNNCVDYGIYLFNTSSPPPNPGWCCFSISPQWTVAGGSIAQGTYNTFSGTINATGNWNGAIVGPFCNGTTGSAACGNYTATRIYFNVDDIVLQLATVLDKEALVLEGSSYNSFHQLQWEVLPQSYFREFRLERSLDGMAFQTLENRLVQELDRNFYDFRDDDPLEGMNHYRLAGTDLDGQIIYSNVLRLQHGFTGSDNGESLDFHYDRDAEEIRFELDAGDGDIFQFELMDIRGRQLKSMEWRKSGGIQTFRLPVDGLAAGIYVIRLKAISQHKIWQNKFVR